MEEWLSGRKHWFAKSAYNFIYTMGSNPISSVTNKYSFSKIKFFIIKEIIILFISRKFKIIYGNVVQLVERMLCKHEVIGSIPIISKILFILNF
jgi:hypothetical protein